MEPAVLVDDLCGTLRVLIVAHHHAFAAHTQFAVRLDLVVHKLAALTNGANVLCVLCKVDDTGGAGLGSAVALDDEHPVVHHIQQHLRVKHGRGADECPQIAQTVAAAAHHVLVQGVHDHRHHGHDLAGHLLDIAVEVAGIEAQIQRPAHDGGGEQVDEGAHMEHGQHHVVAGLGILFLEPRLHLCGDGPHDSACAEQVVFAHHNALAYAGGAGGEHQHHQSLVVNGVQLGHRLVAAEVVHGVQQAAVRSLQLLLVAVVHAIGQNGGRLHQLQLVGHLCPALVLVQRHQHTACHDRAKGVYHILIAVLAQQADLLALHIRDGALEVVDHPADILCKFLKKDGGHRVGILIVVTKSHALGKFLFHAQRDGIVHIIHEFFHCSFLPVLFHLFYTQRTGLPAALRGRGRVRSIRGIGSRMVDARARSLRAAQQWRTALCSVYNIFHGNAILLQHLISCIDNFYLHIIRCGLANFYLSLQSAGSCATIFSAKYHTHSHADCKTKLTVSQKSIILAIYHGDAV